MKDCGSEMPEESSFAESAVMTVAALVITGVVAFCTVLALPAAVDQLAGNSAEVVAASVGGAE